jgi:hypothetical protein
MKFVLHGTPCSGHIIATQSSVPSVFETLLTVMNICRFAFDLLIENYVNIYEKCPLFCPLLTGIGMYGRILLHFIELNLKK